MIKSRTILKDWFSDGKTPTGAQFADWLDSFLHKTEDPRNVYYTSNGVLTTTLNSLTSGVLFTSLSQQSSDARNAIVGDLVFDSNGAIGIVSNVPASGNTCDVGTVYVVDWNSLSNKPIGIVVDPSYIHTDTNYTQTEKTKLSGIESGAQKNSTNTVIDSNYVHTDNNYTDAEKTKLGGIDTGAQKNAANTVTDANYTHTDNNYTTSEKTKLGGIEEGAEKNDINTVIDSNYTHTDNNYDNDAKTTVEAIKNKKVVTDDSSVATVMTIKKVDSAHSMSEDKNQLTIADSVTGEGSQALLEKGKATISATDGITTGTLEVSPTGLKFNGDPFVTSIDMGTKADKIVSPHIDWDPNSFNLPAGRTLKFNTTTTPVISGTSPNPAYYTTVPSNTSLMFGFWSNDNGTTTHVGFFKLKDATEYESIVDIYNGTSWLNNGEYVLRYGGSGALNQSLNGGTVSGFNLTTDITVLDAPIKNLNDVYVELLKKQNRLLAGQAVHINNTDALNPIVDVLTVTPDATLDTGFVADAKMTAQMIASVARTTRPREAVISAFVPANIYTEDTIVVAASGTGYQQADILVVGFHYLDFNIRVDTVDGAGRIVSYTVIRHAANDVTFSGDFDLNGGHGSGGKLTFTSKITQGALLADVTSPEPGDIVPVLLDEVHGSAWDWIYEDFDVDGDYHWYSYRPTGSTRDFVTDPITQNELGSQVVGTGKIADNAVTTGKLDNSLQTTIGLIDINSSIQTELNKKVDKSSTVSILYGTDNVGAQTNHLISDFEKISNKTDTPNVTLPSSEKYPSEKGLVAILKNYQPVIAAGIAGDVIGYSGTEGTLSVIKQADLGVQADWDELDNSKKPYIKNKPDLTKKVNVNEENTVGKTKTEIVHNGTQISNKVTNTDDATKYAQDLTLLTEKEISITSGNIEANFKVFLDSGVPKIKLLVSDGTDTDVLIFQLNSLTKNGKEISTEDDLDNKQDKIVAAATDKIKILTKGTSDGVISELTKVTTLSANPSDDNILTEKAVKGMFDETNWFGTWAELEALDQANLTKAGIDYHVINQ
jgi:hypothetical protein